MTTTIVFEPPCAFLNANDRLHFRKRNDLTQIWRNLAHDHAAYEHSGVGIQYRRAHITVAYRFPTNRRREVSNLQPTSKAIVDGLVDALLIPDDSDAYVVGPDNRREYPNGTPRVTVTIEEIQ